MDSSPPHLILFGCGYVGTAVAERFRQRGARITALTRNEDKAAELRRKNLADHIVVARLDSDDWQEQIPPRAEAVLDCVSSAGGGTEGYRQSYLDGMRAILGWAARGEPGSLGTLVYTGSTGVYPQMNGEEVYETDTGAPENLSETGSILRQTEELLAAECPPAFQRWFVLRLAGIYGPGRHYLLNKLRAGETTLPGSGSHTLNLAQRDDIASAIKAAFDAPAEIANRAYNVADDTFPSKQEVVTWLAEQLHLPAPTFDPEQKNAYARRRTPSGTIPNRKIMNHRLKNELGWSPRYPTFRDGFRNILNTSD